MLNSKVTYDSNLRKSDSIHLSRQFIDYLHYINERICLHKRLFKKKTIVGVVKENNTYL